jgi:hypothetical protein
LTTTLPSQPIIEADPHAGERPHLPITLLVAPRAGRLRILTPERFSGGHEWVDAGQPIVLVEHGEDGNDVVASPVRGRLGAVMGRDGEPVKAGQAVAWVEPT